jgi:hypothetical protein
LKSRTAGFLTGDRMGRPHFHNAPSVCHGGISDGIHFNTTGVSIFFWIPAFAGMTIAIN